MLAVIYKMAAYCCVLQTPEKSTNSLCVCVCVCVFIFSFLNQILSAICLLRAKAYQALDNRDIAKQWLLYLSIYFSILDGQPAVQARS
jgi:hypothetical protein